MSTHSCSNHFAVTVGGSGGLTTPAGEQRAHKGETETRYNMCEIAVVPNPLASHDTDDEQFEQNVRALIGTCRTLYDENPDGLGVIAVYNDAPDTFEYSMFKRPTPDFGSDSDLFEFFAANGGAWRFVIHARLATHGGTGYAQTHPIMVGGCPETDDIKYVIHNGVIRADELARHDLEAEGHVFNTHVDSEVIAHAFGEFPSHEELNDEDEFEEPDAIKGRANFILFGDEAILMRMEAKYNTTTDFTILCNRRKEASVDPDHGYKRTHYGLLTPDGETSFRKAPRKTIYAGNGSNGAWRGTGGYGAGSLLAGLEATHGRTQSNRGDDSADKSVSRGSNRGSYRSSRSESETDDDHERDWRDQTRHHHRAKTVAELHESDKDDTEPTRATVEPPEEASGWCRDHGWYDEEVDGDCAACVHERVNHGGTDHQADFSFDYADSLEYCSDHRTYHNGTCPECVDESLSEENSWPIAYEN